MCLEKKHEVLLICGCEKYIKIANGDYFKRVVFFFFFSLPHLNLPTADAFFFFSWSGLMAHYFLFGLPGGTADSFDHSILIPHL